jgi:uncharacterized protein (DUF2147 family)
LPHGSRRFNKLLETELKKAAVAFVLATASVLAMAQATPAGLWKSIDDDGKTEKSLVRIINTGGVYSGKVEKISDPTKADDKCVKCDDERKDKPILGMTIIWEVRQDAEEPGLFDGGQILDPVKGTSYKVRLKPIEGGKKLEVRGYIGSPMFGRTQTWVRVE